MLRRVDRLVLWVGVGVCAALCLLIGYIFYDAQTVIAGAEQVDEMAPQVDSTTDELAMRWQELNPHIIGWIRLDDTNISYPVLQGNDNNFYLNHNYLDEFAAAGSIFMDYRNDAELADKYTIIYGHRMSGGRMFSDITKFVDGEYFAAHEYGSLYTRQKVLQLRIYAFATIPLAKTRLYDLSAQNEERRREIEKKATWRRNLNIEHKQLLLLSTCNKDANRYRDVLVVAIENRAE